MLIAELIRIKFKGNLWQLNSILLFYFQDKSDKSVLITLKNTFELKY